ncbi:DUF4288 domain-containing protein [Ethanoligenens harbinense]|uniref:DUF4288 domain-containing protein n=1 Tax=Ethanoligenens harbinense TaxID=253239 RepID=UPI0002D40B1E|nr:DUF4288 domain-containing protein [Ethanoligenens harbinense]
MDAHHSDTNTFFAESLLLVKASDFDEAYEVAEVSAKMDKAKWQNMNFISP